MLIYKKYYFDSAHFMPDFDKGHDYNNIHGHSYEVIISLENKLGKDQKWFMNYDDLDNIVKPLIKILDHKILNKIEGLENPTSENLAKWFWNRIQIKTQTLKQIEIIRPRIGGCIYKGED